MTSIDSTVRHLDKSEHPWLRARQVIEHEAAALRGLAAWNCQDQFLQAVEMIESIRGRLIVTGVGKSGHIARKIAATMASTGTPSFYVHSTEASHGDLGMVTSLDAVLLLSNSGETNELKDLVYYAKRHGIGLIAMVGSADSTFAKASDVALVLPSQPEASPLHAPTSSTAMMLALGDALAVVLHERRGFSAEDFSQLHPGGKLGMVLKHVKTVMHRGDALPLVLSGTLIRDALFEMSSKRLGCVAVTDEDGRLMGVVTDGDLRRHMSDDLLQKTVDAVMTSTPKTIESDRLLAEALDRMEQHGITLLLVTDARGYLEGILHVHDCLRLGVA